MAPIKKLRASTLIEVLVAMVISVITLCFGTAIFIKVMDVGNQPQRITAKILIDRIALESVKQKRYLDEKSKLGELTIVKSVSPYKESKTLNLLSIKAFNNDETLVAERNELIIIR